MKYSLFGAPFLRHSFFDVREAGRAIQIIINLWRKEENLRASSPSERRLNIKATTRRKSWRLSSTSIRTTTTG